jgi:hypothetical protein
MAGLDYYLNRIHTVTPRAANYLRGLGQEEHRIEISMCEGDIKEGPVVILRTEVGKRSSRYYLYHGKAYTPVELVNCLVREGGQELSQNIEDTIKSILAEVESFSK